MRSYVSSLERDGLVHQRGVRRTQARPAYVYDVTPAAASLFPTAYAPALRSLLDVLDQRLGADALEALCARWVRAWRPSPRHPRSV